MLLDRKEFLGKLEVVAPALSANELLPILTHYWLTGKTLMAFNDQIAISVPCETEITGAIPGQVLLALVKNSRATNAELTHEGDNLLVKLAAAKIKLAHMSADNFVFDMPKVKGPEYDIKVKDKQAFRDALEVCMLSVGRDTAVTDQLGITLLLDKSGKRLSAYATDNATIAHATIDLGSGAAPPDRVILPAAFVEQMLALDKGAKATHLQINDDSAMFKADEVTLFGRLIVSTSPIDFDDIVSRHFPPASRKLAMRMPTKLKLMLQRAVIITDSMTDQAATLVTCDGERMKFVSRTDRGEITETVLMEGHPEVKVRLGPKLLRSGYAAKFENMLVTEKCAVMTKGNAFYMVSAFTG